MPCQMIYHHGNCLNSKKSFVHPCRLCVEACPHGAISDFKELDVKKCTECGACMTVCPSDGFVDSAMDSLHDYLFKAEEIVLNCPQALPKGYEISCLGIFDKDGWLALMLLAYRKPLTILTGVCALCEDREACAVSVNNLQTVHAEWSGHPRIQIQVRPFQENEVGVADVQIPQKLERREALTGWRRKSREKIESWLPSLKAEEQYLIPLSRQWLIEAWRTQPEEKIPFSTLEVSEQCTSCGICVDICPQGALTQQLGNDENRRLVFEPAKCVQCDRCVKICQPKAMKFSTKWLSYRLVTGKVLLHDGKPRFCAKCGKQVFDNMEPQLCLACATSDPGKRGFFF